MNRIPEKLPRLGGFLTTAGGVIGVLGIIVMRIGLKATISPETHNVVLIREVLSAGGFVVFGMAIALILGGSFVGRRARVPKDEGPVRASAQTDPDLIPDFPAGSTPTPTYDAGEKLPSGRNSS